MIEPHNYHKKQTPKLCADTWSDMMKGKYGENWKRAVTMHPEGGLDCSYEIYVCDCGHWERDTRRTLWQNGDKNHCKIRLPRNRAIKPCYHVCPDCGKRHAIFGESHIDELAEKFGVPVVAKIPVDPKIAALSDAGTIFEAEGLELEDLLDRL